jgi:alpha-mannosidase
MNRRNFAKTMAVSIAGLTAGSALGESSEGSEVPTVYYADGYHGGIIGHMPMGSWRDILNVMRDLPEWKLSLDVEAHSWAELLRRDPQAYAELKTYLDDRGPSARIEIVGCTSNQPYGWAIGGESNIRQLVRGCELIREHFPATLLTTYAVQEPCWSSCLPQILISLGFTGAVLRDPSTAWAGYPAGFDAELVRWVGPDGTAITAVPRYVCEVLEKVYETESVHSSLPFAQKCIEHGILHPAGMCFQDLGWPATPKVIGNYIRYVIWRQYIHGIADQPTRDWNFGIEDTLVTLPWGEHTLQKIAQQVRLAENRLLMAEKLAAMACLEGGKRWPGAKFCEAWDHLLLTQSHDAWITATTRRGREAWSLQVASKTMNAEDAANRIIEASAEALTGVSLATVQTPLGPQWVRVINTLAVRRGDLAELMIATDERTRGLRVLDSSSHDVLCQVVPVRRYLPAQSRARLSRKGEVYPERNASRPVYGEEIPPSQFAAIDQPQEHTLLGDSGESLNAALLLFRPDLPSMGHATYRVEPVYEEMPTPQGSTFVRLEPNGDVILESNLYRLRLDPGRGGVITSLYAKGLNQEFCDPSSERLFNEYRGYFIAQKQWRTSASEPARVDVIEDGPLRARVRIVGEVGGCPCQTIMTVVEGQRRIDVQARFIFGQDTWIGDPWDIKPADRRTEQRRSENDGSWKLQAYFPTILRNQVIYKNAAYDVCRSRNVDTFFQRWDEIKHIILVNWVDVLDEKAGLGLAVLSDHTTAYTHGPDFPLSLVLGWGWEGGFWWGKCPLRGVQQVNYGLVPHSRKWDEAGVSNENARFCEPPVAQIMKGEPLKRSEARSLVHISGNGIEIPTLLMDGTGLLVRLFNAEGDAEERVLSTAIKPERVHLVELNGRTNRELQIESLNGRYQVKLTIPRFGLRTVRYEFPGTAL